MKAPKCRLCGKQHWGSCPDLEASAEAVEAVVASGSVPRSSGVIDTPPTSTALNADRPLSSAERQKRWREKMGDAYRAWNRERMKRLRGG